jgi:hypothetical protein
VVISLSQLCKSAMRSILKLIISLALISTPCILIYQYERNLVNSITQKITQHAIVFCLIRFGIIVLITMLWPYVVRTISYRHRLISDEITYWKAKKFHLLIWLALFDLLVCQNIIGKLINLVITGD